MDADEAIRLRRSVRSYTDQLGRNKAGDSGWLSGVTSKIDQAEKQKGAARKATLAALVKQLEKDAAGSADSARVRMLITALEQLAAATK